jgi:hypothetical protein
MEHGLSRMLMWAELIWVAGLVSFKEIGPVLLLYSYFSVLLVCSLNLNLNFVSIPANICNPVEYFVI